MQTLTQLHTTHWSLIATAPSSAMAAVAAAYQGRCMGMHGFAVEDTQQLLSMCLAGICPWSSFSCPAADLYPGCHVNCSTLVICLACLLHLPSTWICPCFFFFFFPVCECAFLNKGEAMISFNKIHQIFKH